MAPKKISAFPDGNSYVHYNSSLNRLVIANSEGLIKIFNIDDAESEPISIDILDNVTSVTSHDDKNLVLTTTEGKLELVDLVSNASKGVLYRSELPLRDTVFINQGNRVLCGGDENKLVIVDLQTTEEDNKVTNVTLPDQLLNVAYNYAGELASVSLSNGDVQIYSVVNEEPNLLHTIKSVLPSKIHVSMDKVDFNEEHHDELLSTSTAWSQNGQYLLVPTVDNQIHVYDRQNWDTVIKKFNNDRGRIVDFKLLSLGKLAILSLNVYKVYDFDSGKLIHEDDFEFDEDAYPLNLDWKEGGLFVGSTNGESLQLENVVLKAGGRDVLTSLFVSDAEDDEEDEGNDTDTLLRKSDDEQDIADLETEDIGRHKKRRNNLKLHEEDDLIIDEDDGDLGLDEPVSRNGKGYRSNGHKRFKSSSPAVVVPAKIKPYSPGSTPFENKGAAIDRRYLTMNNIGYAWIVQNKEAGNTSSTNNNSITVSFFDRSLHSEYHFTDFHSFDLASMNQRGILLGSSASGLIYYRSHSEATNDQWERKLPLLTGEYITSICITDLKSAYNTIVVGTSLGYLRFFNQFGVCINIMKVLPVVSLIASATSNLFMINQVSHNVYSYLIIDINQEYKYIQHNAQMPLRDTVPLIKGIFFNEFNDPCIVGGEDDTLLVLHSWRDTQNAKWVPILNCHLVLTEYGSNENKRSWKCWPLGLTNEKLNCLILKNNNQYPGFPLPLPIELDIELPIKLGHEEDEAEENFLRSLTMGKLVSDSLNDDLSADVDEDEVMERLNQYSILFDKSLLKLFGEACKESKLGKAFSIARLIKTDKALLAASRISERMEFMTLATKIGQLRELLVDIDSD
ncbi:DNA polymerase alpha-binding protein [Candida viswanathii]|uniref:DNA polymerase alpha-binding protein n=1 Tax=Candida viswanathii TaxID=5486 RepID=A0A367XST3_9ASCO|nr:DNA polymerase alpha-binding protein [Candida viswanathii]